MTQRKTKEEWHAELQERFRNTVYRMIQCGCPLPDDFNLYHAVHERVNREEHTVSYRSFLTKQAAQQACEPDVTVGGDKRAWHVEHYRVVKNAKKFEIDRMYI
jgi:hypothetical protein